MSLFKLALRSAQHRKIQTALVVVSVALSFALLLMVEKIREGAETGFSATISQTDLIVGGRGSPLNLLLYTVFGMGQATNNVSMESFQYFSQHPAVEWVIPISLGDSHRGYRTVATDERFFQHYRFRGGQRLSIANGRWAEGVWDVVLGAEVARKLNYQLGTSVVLTHGVSSGPGLLHHDDKPFTVVGVLERTGTALDRSLYITLAGTEAIHIDWTDGGYPSKENRIGPEQIRAEDLVTKTITAFLLRTKSRIETLRLQREINTYPSEPLTAAIPGATLAQLWQGLSYVESVLQGVSVLVLVIGFLSLLIALFSMLETRRREMALLRAVGASPMQLTWLLTLEGFWLTLLGLVAGWLLCIGVFALLGPWLAMQYGIYLDWQVIKLREWIFFFVFLLAGTLVAWLPAWLSAKATIKEGFVPR